MVLGDVRDVTGTRADVTPDGGNVLAGALEVVTAATEADHGDEAEGEESEPPHHGREPIG
jgi:hypothetical protein